MGDDLDLRCPNCSRALVDGSLDCSRCGVEGSVRRGIPSFVAPSRTTGRGWLTPTERDRFASRVESEPIRNATSDLFDGHDRREELLGEVYDVRRDSWRVFAAEHLDGRCLDLQAGYGRRSHALAELVDEVYAVDPTLDKLRVLAARDDYGGGNVRPIHTTPDRLPFPEAAFDTVVADLTERSDLYFREQVSYLERYLADEGTVVLIADGLINRLGLAKRLGLDPRRAGSIGRYDVLPLSPRGYRKVLRSLGFETVDAFPLLRTARDVDVVFGIDDHNAVRVLTEGLFSGNDLRVKGGKTAIRTASRVGLLDYAYPSYCVVGRRGTAPSPNDRSLDFENPYLITGRSRSIVLDFVSGELDRISKVPNRRDDVSINEREHRVISELRSTNEPIADALPDGHTTATKFGPVRHEEPAEGTRLSSRYDGHDPASFRRTLRIGYDWLIEFQRTFGGDRIVRSPEEARSDLSFPPLDIRPPEIDAPVETFRTPVHGDYLPANVYVRDDEVVTVIDWEYGAMSGWPVVDAGVFLFNVAKQVFGGVREGIRAVFRDENEYATVADECIREYCSTVGIPYRSFVLYLPAIYLHRLKLDWQADAMTTYTDKSRDRAGRVELLRTVTTELVDNRRTYSTS